jgi:UDPglucose 6-dehydrogenase
VVGFGIVGKAQAYLLQRLGHEVFVYDPYVLPDNRLKRRVDLTFICTPEANVEEALKTLISEKVDGLYVIKSTTPVGTTGRLMRKYDVHICHNPEFLRQKYAYEDVMNPDRVVIGKCCDMHGEFLRKVYAPLGKPIFVTSPTVSELAKLVSNAYLSMLITFWNEVDEYAKKSNLKTAEIAKIVCADKRISRYGTSKFGEPFTGNCLPKDLDQLINAYFSINLNPALFETIKEINQELMEKYIRKSLLKEVPFCLTP